MKKNGLSRVVIKKNSDKISLFSYAIFYFLVVSSLAMIAMINKHFEVPLVLGVSALVTLAAIHLTREHSGFKLHKPSLLIIAIGIVAWLLRKDIYTNLMGGQDQGLYVSMSEGILKSKGLYFVDQFRASLPRELLPLYDSSLNPSVGFIDAEKSLMNVHFYPMHPLWLATSTWIFGAGKHTFALLLYSIVYMSSGYKLTKLLFDDKRGALIALTFLAINPALVFFSKFPVTEMLAFAFTVTGFLFLVQALRVDSKIARIFYLAIGILSFNAMFYTRPQFFIFLPLFCILALGSFLPIGNKSQRYSLFSFVVSTVALFGLSLVYYYKFQYGLFDAIYGHIGKLVNIKVGYSILTLAGLSAIGLSIITRFRKSGESRLTYLAQLSDRFLAFAPLAFFAVLLMSILSVYNFYKNPVMTPFPWDLPLDQDKFIFRYHVLYRYFLIISPPVFLVLAFTFFYRMTLTRTVKIGFLFLTICWSVILLQPSVPYLYYYGRYLCSEMVPYSLLMAGGLFGMLLKTRGKYVSIVLLLLTVGYFTKYSSLQYGKIESDNIEFHEEVLKKVSEDDILIGFGSEFGTRLISPMRIYHGLRFFIFDSPETLAQNWSLVAPALQKLLEKSNGKLIYMTARGYHEPTFHSEGEADLLDAFFSNSEHLRLGQIYSPSEKTNLELPFKYEKIVRPFYFNSIDNQTMLENIAHPPGFLSNYPKPKN